MRPELVIFDCDGVLVDSEATASRVLCTELQTLGLSLSEESVDARFRGRSLRDCLRDIEGELGRQLPATFIHQLNERTYQEFAKSLKAIRGVKDALTLIREACVPVCVASSGSVEKMQLTLGLTDLLPYFEGVLFSASQVRLGKPAPDLFLHAAKEMGALPERCVVIEDSLPGVLGARAAGAHVLGYVEEPDLPQSPVAEREARRQAFSELGAVVFSRMTQLPELLSLRQTHF